MENSSLQIAHQFIQTVAKLNMYPKYFHNTSLAQRLNSGAALRRRRRGIGKRNLLAISWTERLGFFTLLPTFSVSAIADLDDLVGFFDKGLRCATGRYASELQLR
jgi:hypothetical protein